MPTWQGYLSEARKFWEIAELADDGAHTSQAVSNVIHAAIAIIDAVCLYRGYVRPAGDPHVAAGPALQAALKGTKWEAEASRAATQLVQVIKQKNEAEYLGKAIRPEAADRALKQVERVLQFAQRVLPPLPGESGGPRAPTAPART